MKNRNLTVGAAMLAVLVTPLSAQVHAATQLRTDRAAATRHVAPHRRPAYTCVGVGPYSFLGGGVGNVADGIYSAVLGGLDNEACVQASGIGTGDENIVYNLGTNGFIAGGSSNTVTNHESFIGAGTMNSTSVKGGDGAIVAGSDNQITSPFDFIGAGSANLIGSSSNPSGENAEYAAIGGGVDNFIGSATANSVGGFIGAGDLNVVSADQAAVVAGESNTASGVDSFIGGGNGNTASGIASFAGGTSSVAGNRGTFVWSDAFTGATQLSSSGANQFLVRASGGVKFYSNSTLTSGVTLAAGGGSWASVSDRKVKSHVVSIDDESVLDRLVALPVTEWSYNSESPSVRHVGPMAQDFYAAFKIGEDDRHITSIDEDGIALAAIKGLYTETTSDNARLRGELVVQKEAFAAQLKSNNERLDRLQSEVSALEAELKKSDR